MDGTEINSIVSAIKGHLKLKVISVVLGSVGDLADKLGNVGVRLTRLLSPLISVDEIASIYIFIRHMLGQTSDLFLSYLSCGLPTLHLS